MSESDDSQNTRPISVAELLARNGTIGAPPAGGRRRRRRGNADAISVSELTGEIPIIRDEPVKRPVVEPVADEPVAEELVADEPAVDEPVADEAQSEAEPERVAETSETVVIYSAAEESAATVIVGAVDAEAELDEAVEVEDAGVEVDEDAADEDAADEDAVEEEAVEEEAVEEEAAIEDSVIEDAVADDAAVDDVVVDAVESDEAESDPEPDDPEPEPEVVTDPPPRSEEPLPRRASGPELSHYPRPVRPSGAEQMAPDPLDDSVDLDELLAEHDEDAEELRSYLKASSGTLFSGETIADDIARRGVRGEPAVDSAAAVVAAESARPGGIRTALAAVFQSVLAVVFGAGLFLAFDQLWRWNTIVALVLSVLVILGLVVAVRVVRKTEDIGSTLIAVAVGALVTLGPLALLQST
ncbi:MAG: hypothetical protein ACOYBX_09515 [Mycobacterium sp.]